MASPILTAISRGFSSRQILTYLRRAFPQYAKQIQQAEAAGFAADQIVRFLENGRQGVSELPEEQLTLHEQTREGHKKKEKDLAKTLGKGALLGGLALTGIGSALGAGGAAARGAVTLLPALPNNPQVPQIGGPQNQLALPYNPPGNPQPPINPTGMPPNPQPQGNPPQPIPPNAPMPSPPQAQQPQTMPTTHLPNQVPNNPPQAQGGPQASHILWNMLGKKNPKGLDPQIDAFLNVSRQIKQTGGLNSKEEFDKFHQLFENLRKNNLPIPELAKELFNEYDVNFTPQQNAPIQPQNPSNAPQKGPNLPPNVEKIEENGQIQPENAKIIQESPKNEQKNLSESTKTKFVRLSDGQIAEVKGEKGKVYKVNAAGKERLIPKKKAETEPPSVSNSHVTFDLSKVPEEDRSAALSFVEMPKSRKDIIIKFGLTESPYRYWRKDGKPISEHLAMALQKGMTLPITDGDEFMGAWNSDKADSRGTVSSKEIIQKSQEFEGKDKEGKNIPDDPSKEYWMEPLESVFIHGYFKQFYDELGIKKETFDRAKAERLLREGKRKKARKEKNIQRRYE
jgi:hypothetical protein